MEQNKKKERDTKKVVGGLVDDFIFKPSMEQSKEKERQKIVRNRDREMDEGMIERREEDKKRERKKKKRVSYIPRLQYLLTIIYLLFNKTFIITKSLVLIDYRLIYKNTFCILNNL